MLYFFASWQYYGSRSFDSVVEITRRLFATCRAFFFCVCVNHQAGFRCWRLSKHDVTPGLLGETAGAGFSTLAAFSFWAGLGGYD